MIKKNDKTIIGIDHGYGYTKTASQIFSTGVEELIIAPPFKEDIVTYNGSSYVVGQHRTEQLADKTLTQDYYVLTLAAIAREMKANKMTKVNNLVISAGLPYSFMTAQAENFKKYLGKNKNVSFTYEGKKYEINIKTVKIFPQGFPIISNELGHSNKKEITVADVGSRTIDVLSFVDGKPIYDKCFSIDRKGTLDCIDTITKYYLGQFQETIEESIIQDIFQGKQVMIPPEKEKFIKKIISIYVRDIFKTLNAKGINHNVTYCGGGATVIKNYAMELIDATDSINDDIHGNAKGYEALAYNML